MGARAGQAASAAFLIAASVAGIPWCAAVERMPFPVFRVRPASGMGHGR